MAVDVASVIQAASLSQLGFDEECYEQHGFVLTTAFAKNAQTEQISIWW